MAGFCFYCNTINESGLKTCKNPNCAKPLGKLVGYGFSGIDDSSQDPLDSEDLFSLNDSLGSEDTGD